MNSHISDLRGTLARIELPAMPRRARDVLRYLSPMAFRHRKPVAVALSLLLHVLFLWLLLPRAQHGLSGGGSNGAGLGVGTGETWYAVNLQPLPSSALDARIKAPEDAAAEALDAPDAAAKPSVEAVQSITADKPQPAKLDTSPATPAMAGAGQSGTTAGAGDLWTAIAPCWKRVAGEDTLPVTLEISFTAGGALAKPPVIDRAADAAITPQSLRSEAQALSALAQCGAYPMAAGRSGVKVDFPRPE